MSGLGEETGTSLRETFALLGRAFSYAAPFKARFVAKYLLALLSLLPLLVLPWPVKIIVDHAVLGIPIGEQPLPYPEILSGVMAMLATQSPEGIVLILVGVQLVLVALCGAVGTSGNERDFADSMLSSGHDIASRTENEANYALSLTSGLLGLIDWRVMIRLTQEINHHYRTALFARLQRLPMTTFDDESIGDAVFRVMYDTPAITGGIYRIVVWPFVWGGLGTLAALCLATFFPDHPIFWQAGLGLMAISFLAGLPFSGMLRERHGDARREGSNATASLEEGLHNILAVQSLGAEDHEQDRFDKDSWASFSQYRGVMAIGMGIVLLGAVPGVTLLGFVAYSAIELVVYGAISAGDFGLLLTYFIALVAAAFSFGGLWIRLQENAAGLKRVFFVMDLPNEEDPPDATSCPALCEAVQIEAACFDYPDGTPALRGVDLEARVGQVTALVGPAGAGKTTLAYLIPRFVEPASGRVCFDRVDTAQASLASLREQIAFVFQETQLFDATVDENLRIGNREASEAQIRRAAQIAGADDFIRALPKGYHTPLGRGGGRLSVGQRQRLAIARGLVREARVLILDEPTSALDPETEQNLVAALRTASQERAVIVIAHRLSTIREADQICFLDDGRIIERGNHAELMALENGAYRSFVELQSISAA